MNEQYDLTTIFNSDFSLSENNQGLVKSLNLFELFHSIKYFDNKEILKLQEETLESLFTGNLYAIFILFECIHLNKDRINILWDPFAKALKLFLEKAPPNTENKQQEDFVIISSKEEMNKSGKFLEYKWVKAVCIMLLFRSSVELSFFPKLGSVVITYIQYLNENLHQYSLLYILQNMRTLTNLVHLYQNTEENTQILNLILVCLSRTASFMPYEPQIQEKYLFSTVKRILQDLVIKIQETKSIEHETLRVCYEL